MSKINLSFYKLRLILYNFSIILGRHSMENIEEVRKKIARLIVEKGLNYAQVSLAIGKNIAYIQQFIKNGSPRRLGEVERHKLAQLLQVDEQELTDLPLNIASSAASAVNSDILGVIIENVEEWLESRSAHIHPKDKAELIKLIYLKVCSESTSVANEKVKNFLDIYSEFKKVN